MAYFDVIEASTTLLQLAYKVTLLYFYQQFSKEADSDNWCFFVRLICASKSFNDAVSTGVLCSFPNGET